MKRLCCALLALCFLCCAAVPGVAEAEEWTPLESRFGFSLWYPKDQLDFWTGDRYGKSAEGFCPKEDHSGVAEMVCRGSRFSVLLWDDYTRITLDGPEAALNYPYEATAYTDGDVIAEQWIVSAPDGDYVFILQYEVGDYQGWAPLFHAVLETLEFPDQPAANADFHLEFFQGGAAGMEFCDLVVDDEADPIAFIPLREMTGFALEYLSWDTDTMTPTVAMTLYATSILHPGSNLRVSCYFDDIFPNLRVRYTDAEGKAQCFYFFQSGRDGSLLLLTEDAL